jgi:dihydrolipoamide dehydrogenase
MSEVFDLVVIGAGPGGYVAAIRGAQLGLKTACVEKEVALGGTCLRVGCIPSKALLESSALYEHTAHGLAEHGVIAQNVGLNLAAMQKRKANVVDQLCKGIAGLLKKNKVTHLKGLGQFVGQNSDGTLRLVVAGKEVQATRVIIATGSKEAPLRNVTFGERVGSSTDALAYSEVPKHLVVIGAGAIGLELGSVWRRLGAQVTVLEYLDRILPGMDNEIATQTKKILEQQGLVFKLGTKVTGVQSTAQSCKVEIDGQDPVACDRVLVSVGRLPNTDGLGLEAIGLKLDDRGRVPVDKHFATAVSGVYAIGDVIVGPMLAHKAEEEGMACVEFIATGYGHVDYNAIPAIVYTEPEVASVGQTEEQLKEKGIAYRKGTFPFMANGRAKALGDTRGLVKVLADANTDRILGVHIVGKHAGDLIAECVGAMSFGASSEDLARVCHAHPTMSEAVKEAALAVDKRAIHI